jgi:hypothetical protein
MVASSWETECLTRNAVKSYYNVDIKNLQHESIIWKMFDRSFDSWKNTNQKILWNPERGKDRASPNRLDRIKFERGAKILSNRLYHLLEY